jgi:hypothetical protein
MIEGAKRVEIADVEVLDGGNLVMRCRVGDRIVRVPSLGTLSGTEIECRGDRRRLVLPRPRCRSRSRLNGAPDSTLGGQFGRAQDPRSSAPSRACAPSEPLARRLAGGILARPPVARLCRRCEQWAGSGQFEARVGIDVVVRAELLKTVDAVLQRPKQEVRRDHKRVRSLSGLMVDLAEIVRLPVLS